MPQTALRMPDGTIQAFDNDRIPEAVAAGAEPPQFVRVDVPGGGQSEVPWETFLALSQQRPGDIRLTSQDSIDSQAHLADLEDETSTVGAFGRNLAEAASFGLYKPDDDQQLADRYYHGTASTVGQVAGTVGPLLIPGLGEVGLAGRAAEAGNLVREGATVADLLGATGRVGTELLPGRMAAQLGARTYEALGGGLKGALAGGAIEGAGSEVLRSVLDRDHRLSGESLLDSAGMNALGAGVGYGLAKGVEAAESAFDKLGRRATKAASKVDDPELVSRLESNRPLTAKQLGRTEEELGNEIKANLNQDIPLHSANKDLERDARRMFKDMEAWRASPFGQVAPEVAPIVDRGVESLGVLRNFAKQDPTVQARVMGAYESHLHNVDEMVTALQRTPGGLDVNTLPMRWRPENVVARQEAISKLDPTGLAPAEMAAKRLAARLTAGTGRVNATKEVEGGFLSRILKGNDRRGNIVSQHPLASMIVLDSIVDGGILHAGATVLAARAAAKVVKKAWEVPGRGIALSGLAAEHLDKLGLGSHDLPDDRAKRAQTVAERIRNTTPDDARRMASERSQHVSKVSPDAFVAVGDTAANRHRVLQARVNEIMPAPRGAVQMRSTRPSPTQVRELERTVAVAADPTAFARMLSEDKLTSKDLQLARAIWPAHVQRATQLASAWLAEHQGEVPRSVAKRLEMLLGPDAVGSVHEDSFIAAQQAIMAAKQRLKPQGSPPPSPSPGKERTDLLSPADGAGSRPSD